MKDQYKSQLEALVSEGAFKAPKEQMVRIQEGKGGFGIGIPREVGWQETRVALTPDAVQLLMNNGHEIAVEANAGSQSGFTDSQYSEAGAKIIYDRKQLFNQSDVILKVGPPPIADINQMKNGAVLLSALQSGHIPRAFFEALNKKRITGLAYEFLKDPSGGMPVMRAMSEIAGLSAVAIAGEHLTSLQNGQGIVVGSITGVPPTKVIILGAGTVAEFAARALLGMGADVKVFDNHIYKLRRLRSLLGGPLFTSTVDQTNLMDAMRRADVVIGAARGDEGLVPCMVTEDMVAAMKENALIIDVSIDQGGCFETSKVTTLQEPIFKYQGVLHYCVPNIASRVPRSASTALSNIMAPVLIKAIDYGSLVNYAFEKDWLMSSVYAYQGNITKKHLANRLNLPYKDLALLRIARY